MKILITGHRGFIGSKLYSHLIQQDYTVFGVDKKDGMDLSDPIQSLPDVDLIYHLAAQTSVVQSMENPMLDLTDNVLSMMTLIQRYPDTRIIYTGSGGASEQQAIESPYGLSKKMAGMYLKLLHKDYVICNLSNIFGEGGKGVVERFLSEEKITIYGDGTQTRDFVHVSDILFGLSLAKTWPIGEYFLGSGKSIAIIQLARMFGKEIIFDLRRPGELLHSYVPNTTPNWQPMVDLEVYLSRPMLPEPLDTMRIGL